MFTRARLPQTLVLLTTVLVALAGPARAADQPEIVRLSEADVTGVISAMGALTQMGLNYAAKSGDDGMPPAEAWGTEPEARAILARNNFTPERFASVAHSVGMAFAALQINPEQLEASMAQQASVMKQMGAYLSPEQLTQMRAQMEQSRVQIARMRDQPPENVALVRRHQGDLQKVMMGMGQR